MDGSRSGYPWNNEFDPSDYHWDDTDDLQDIICSIEEDFPEDLTHGTPSYVATPYNNPLFELLSRSESGPAPHFSAPSLPAPHPVASSSTSLHSPVPPHQPPPVLSSPGPPTPGPSAPGPSAPAIASSASASTSAAKPLNFIMVMDGEKGKRISRKTGVMKRTRRARKTTTKLADYDPHKPLVNTTIVAIVEEAQQHILQEAVRETRLTDQEDRVLKVKDKLKAAAKKHFPTDETNAAAWAERNWVSLYNELSRPLTDVMRKLKSVAESQYIQGYELRPGARSPDALREKDYAKKRVQELIPPATPDDEFAMLAFIHDHHSNPLENSVIWNVLLDTISMLGYNKHIGDAESLNRLFMSTTAAIFSCLDQIPKGRRVHFSKAEHGFIYDKVDLFMNRVIYADKVKKANWIEYRRITHLKLTAA